MGHKIDTTKVVFLSLFHLATQDKTTKLRGDSADGRYFMTLYRDIRTGVLVKEVQTLTERTVVVETLRGRPRRYIAYKTELRAVTFYTRKNSTE